MTLLCPNCKRNVMSLHNEDVHCQWHEKGTHAGAIYNLRCLGDDLIAGCGAIMQFHAWVYPEGTDVGGKKP